MNTLVIENVLIGDLPDAWRRQLAATPGARITVRIDAQAPNAETGAMQELTENPLFGLWKDRTDMAEVAPYVRQLRASRFNPDGSRQQD